VDLRHQTLERDCLYWVAVRGSLDDRAVPTRAGLDSRRKADIVDHALGSKLRQEPNPLLIVGEW
jgi:hypothetical protein